MDSFAPEVTVESFYIYSVIIIMTNELIIWKQNIVSYIFLHKNQVFFQSLSRNRDKLGLVLNPRDGLEERDDIFIFFLLF